MKKWALSIFLSILTSCVWAEEYTTTAEVNVRAGTDAHDRVLGRLKKNITIEATPLDGNWYKVSYNGHEGYLQGTYLVGITSPIEAGSQWDDTDTIFLVIGGVLAIIAIIFARNVYISSKNKGRRYRDNNALAPKTAYWYQCRHCSVSIYNGTEPKLAGCVSSVSHHWINLGHVGADQYMCRKCSIIINVAAEPVLDGCAGGEEHHWRKF